METDFERFHLGSSSVQCAMSQAKKEFSPELYRFGIIKCGGFYRLLIISKKKTAEIQELSTAGAIWED